MILSNITLSGGMTFEAIGAISPVAGNIILELDAANSISYPGTGNTWFDLSGNDHDATLVDVPTWTSNDSGYFEFTTGNYMTLPTGIPLQGVTEFSYNSWAWYANVATGGNPGRGSLFSYGFNFTNDILVSCYQGFLFTQINNDSDGSAGLNIPALDSWLNICIVYDGAGSTNEDKLKMYVNGVEQTLSFGEYTVPAVTSSIGEVTPEIGRYSLSQGDTELQFAGRLAYTSLYDKALSGAEVTQNFNALKGRYGL